MLFCAQQVVGFMLFKLLLPYLRFSWDSLDFLSPFGRTIISRAQRVGEYIYSAYPCLSVGGVTSPFSARCQHCYF